MKNLELKFNLLNKIENIEYLIQLAKNNASFDNDIDINLNKEIEVIKRFINIKL